jgi:hypothetical protein
MRAPDRLRCLILVGILALGIASAAEAESYVAVIDGSQAVPPNNSECVGHGTFVLSADETQLAYDIHFEHWFEDEFISHIHEAYAPPQTGERILVEIAPGPDKVGVVDLEPGDVIALRTSRLFVNVHTLSFMQGEVRGWIVPTIAAQAATWGRLRAIYR